MEYETKLFDTDQIMDIDILMDEDDWNDMLENAISEVYYSCDVVINGKKFYSVGIRPKGNTSLSSIASDPDTDRYSFKLEFDHYIEGQTCYGLDKLILNNNYADATNMKEAVVYDMYQYLDVDASLYNYAKICVNGDYRGVYLTLEAVEDSFMLRNYGTEDGNLYKPESMGVGVEKNREDSQDSDSEKTGEGRPDIDRKNLNNPVQTMRKRQKVKERVLPRAVKVRCLSWKMAKCQMDFSFPQMLNYRMISIFQISRWGQWAEAKVLI